MEEHNLYYSVACIIAAVYAMVKGVIAALAQRSDPEAASLFPPPAYGVVASILLTFGLGFLKLKLPWWGYRLIFPGTTMLFPAIIYLIGRRPSPK
ncbi:MAG: hypothetical protein NHB36_06625 [Nitrospira sp.]|nr:hypothetical protein [Nitrospira sp.]